MAQEKSIEWTHAEEQQLINNYEFTDDLDALCNVVGKHKLAVKSRIGDLRNDGILKFKPMINWKARVGGSKAISKTVTMTAKGIHIPIALLRFYGYKVGDVFEIHETPNQITLKLVTS